MKLAIFQYDLGLGGIQKSLVNLLNNLDYSKYQVDLYLFKQEKFFDLKENNNLRIIYKKPLAKFLKILPFSLVRKFFKNDIDESYDVVINFDSYSVETALYATTVKSLKRYIYSHNDVALMKKHEWKYRVFFNLSKSKYKYFDAFIGISRGALYSLNDALGRSRKSGYIIANIIDTNEIYEKKSELTNFKVSNKNFNLVSIGCLTYQKGFDKVLEIVAKVNRKDLKLYIIGDGPLKNKIKREIKRLKLEDTVVLLGALKNPFPIMKQMDAFILTSRYEGQAITTLEAKALGLQIFIPTRLEKYNENIKGYKNLVKEIKSARRYNKTFNYLTEYNEKALNSFYQLLEEE